jgi:isopenicillin N synthase-like dioxygenase
MSLQIPVVSLNSLKAKDNNQSLSLTQSLSQFGLIHITDHGIDEKELNELYECYRAFTKLPDSVKSKLGGEQVWYQRGWTPPNTEKAVIANGQPDFKECYFIAPIEMDQELKLEFPELIAENIWPENMPRFRELYMKIGKQVHEIGLVLLNACERALGLEEDTFKKLIEGGAHVSRLLRYLPISEEQIQNGVLWGEEHTDFNLLTLLPGGRFYDVQDQACTAPDDGSGLFLRAHSQEHPEGVLLSGTAPKGCMVAQIGQQLEILTGGRFLATPHVITPPKTTGYTRMSFAHFMHVHPHHLLTPLKPFRTTESIKAYRPAVMAGSYDVKTLVDIGLAPVSALESLGYRHYSRLEKQRGVE